MSVEVEPYYQKRAQEIIDTLVDKGFIRDDVKREDTRLLEDYIGYILQSTAESAARVATLLKKVKS